MLLIVVLVMVVVLTVSLAAATRSITNIRISSEEESSERAFSAAEAGLERALGGNLTNASGTLDNTSSYNAVVTQQSGVDVLLNNNIAVLKDDAADVWLSTYPGYTNPYTGNITIYWGSPGDTCNSNEASNTMAALDIVVISGTVANPSMRHIPVDPCPQRRNANNFGSIVGGGGSVRGQTFAYGTTIAVNAGLIARIIPLYSSTVIGIRGCNGGGGGCNTLPAQGTTIESTGTSQNAQRKIITFRGYPKLPPELFPFVLFTPN